MAFPGTSSGADARAPLPQPPGLVLLVDDEPLLLRSLRRILESDGHRTVLAETAQAALPLLVEPELDVVLVDLFLGHSSGMELLERVKRERPELEVIVMTGHATIESAVGCIRRGAFDYLAKPFDDIYRVRTIESLRHNESSVLLQGESGTGKELVARAIHAASPRAEGPFVPVDCGALPETIIESELFGNEKGAFTGALGAQGLFRMADGGTLFLDEIGEIPLPVQAKLLRALQEREVRPLGAARTVPVDLRVVSATHRDLAEMVAAGRFRSDLYYRLNVVRLEVPPLRERREDVPLLVHHFLRKHGGAGALGIEDAALEMLVAAAWPGNVRELENAIESALALAPGPRLRVADFPHSRRGPGVAASPPPADLPLSLAAYERCVLERALAECGGDAREAARRLGIGRSTLYRKLARHGIRPAAADPGAKPAIR
jgi:two-component system response regulator GlrR